MNNPSNRIEVYFHGKNGAVESVVVNGDAEYRDALRRIQAEGGRFIESRLL